MLNKVMIIGRLGKDPDVKHTGTGKTVCTLSVATSKKINGEEQTEWHRVVLWERTAEVAGQYLAKGSLVYIEGEIRTRSYESGGEKRYATEIVGHSMQMLGERQERREQPVQTTDEELNDDIPF